MAGRRGNVRVSITADSDGLKRGVRDAERHLDRLDGAAGKAGRGLSTGAKAAGAMTAALGGALVVEAKRAFDAFDEARKVTAQTEAVIKSTGGAAKVTALEVEKLASAIQAKTGIDDESIRTSANLLLTFKQVRNEVGRGNDVFNRATQAAVDLSAAGFGSLDSAAKQLGKALNDPVKGMTALGRAGVTFTQAQKDQIEKLVEQNRALDAQKIILREVESQVSGSAQAQATNSMKLKVAIGDLEEAFGRGLAPVVDDVAGKLRDLAVDALPHVERASRALERVWGRTDLDLGEKLTFSGRALAQNLRPVRRMLERELGRAELGPKLAEAIDKAVPKIMDAAAAAAPKAAETFVKAWLDAGAWAKLLGAAFLLHKLGGLKALTAVGGTAGAASGAGYTAGAAGAIKAGTPALAAAAAGSWKKVAGGGLLFQAGTASAGSIAGGMAGGLAPAMERQKPKVAPVAHGFGKWMGRGVAVGMIAGVAAFGPDIAKAIGDEVKKGLENELPEPLRRIPEIGMWLARNNPVSGPVLRDWGEAWTGRPSGGTTPSRSRPSGGGGSLESWLNSQVGGGRLTRRPPGSLAGGSNVGPWRDGFGGAGGSGSGTGGSSRSRSNAGDSVVSWARGAVGRFRESTGSNRGPELDRLQREFSMVAQAWCAMFATKALVEGGASKAVKTASVAQIRQWASQGISGYQKGLKSTPRPGDLMLFGNAHVGVVEKVNRSAGTVTTIEGNTSAGKVARRTHRIGAGSYARARLGGSAASFGPELTRDQAIIERAARKYGIDPAVLWGIYGAETNFGKNKRDSPKGARGPFQLMPDTARSLGVRNPRDLGQASMGAAKYMRQLLDMFGGDVNLALAAYNAGPGAVRRHGGIPPYRQTRAYVPKVLRLGRRFPDLETGDASSIEVDRLSPSELRERNRAWARSLMLPIARSRRSGLRLPRALEQRAGRRIEALGSQLELARGMADLVEEDTATPEGRATRLHELGVQRGMTLNVGFQQRTRLNAIRRQTGVLARTVKRLQRLLKTVKNPTQRGEIKARIRQERDRIRELQAEARSLDSSWRMTGVEYDELTTEMFTVDREGRAEQSERWREMAGALAELTPGGADDLALARMDVTGAEREYATAVASKDPRRIAAAARKLKDSRDSVQGLERNAGQQWLAAIQAQAALTEDLNDDVEVARLRFTGAERGYQEALASGDTARITEAAVELKEAGDGLKAAGQALKDAADKAIQQRMDVYDADLLKAQILTPDDTTDDLAALRQKGTDVQGLVDTAIAGNDVEAILKWGPVLLGIRDSIKGLEQQATQTNQHLADLEREAKERAQRELRVSQTQYGALKKALADAVSGEIGGRVGLGFQTPSVAGRVAGGL
jgi:hypothetical protein